MMRFRKGVVDFLVRAIGVVAVAIVIGLLGLSFFVTCRMSVQYEHIYFLSSSVLPLVCGLLVCLCFAYLLRREKPQRFFKQIDVNPMLYKRILRGLLIFYLAFSVVFVLIVQANSMSYGDQLRVSEAATKLKIDSEDDWIPIEHPEAEEIQIENGYLARWPNQSGLVLAEYIGGFLFGTNNFVVFSLINCAALALIICEFEKIMTLWGWKNCTKFFAIIGIMMYLPLIQYCTYAYGNIIGLAFSLRAIRHALAAHGVKKKRELLLCVLDFIVAILIKQNYLIFAIATASYLFLDALKRKKVLINMVAIFAILVSSVLALKVPQAIIVNNANADTSTSAPMIEWVNMGVSDHGHIAPGWWDENIKTLENETQVDGDKIRTLSKKQLIRRLKYLVKHKKKALIFFLRKIASCWLDPNFEGIYINRRTVSQADLTRPSWLMNWLSAIGETQQAYYMQPYVALIFFGFVYYIIESKHRKKRLKQSLPLLIFVGGFTFHLIWETKSQYTFEYFVLLIPFATKGCVDFCRTICRKNKKKPRAIPAALAGLCMAGMVGLVIFLGVKNIATDNKVYVEYIEATDYWSSPSEGTYNICIDEERCLSIDKKGDRLAMTKDNAAEISIKRYNSTLLLGVGDHQYLKLASGVFWLSRLDVSDNRLKWHMSPQGDGYNIVCGSGGSYLDYDAKTKKISCEPFQKSNKARKWYLKAL